MNNKKEKKKSNLIFKRTMVDFFSIQEYAKSNCGPGDYIIPISYNVKDSFENLKDNGFDGFIVEAK